MIRVFCICTAVWLLSWYSTEGIAPWVSTKYIRIHGGAGGYSVDCISVRFGNDTTVIGSLPVPSALPEGLDSLPMPPSQGGTAWMKVRPFADSARAVLLTFENASMLICDSLVFAPRPEGAPSRFLEKIDLLLIPPADEKAVLELRAALRPRMIAVIPPCIAPEGQNIVCGTVSPGGTFSYTIMTRGRKLKLVGGY